MNKQEMVMTGSGSSVVPPQKMPDEKDTSIEIIDTRFGKVKINRKNPIVFPNGMLGMPDKFEYCLTDFSSDKLKRFKLLQSLDDLELSFICLPVALDNSIIDKQDIILACKDIEIPENDVALLLVVTVHRQSNGVKLSVNARAPLFISTLRRVATQYVFHNNKYEIQHLITF